jgi:hypothetical protein
MCVAKKDGRLTSPKRSTTEHERQQPSFQYDRWHNAEPLIQFGPTQPSEAAPALNATPTCPTGAASLTGRTEEHPMRIWTTLALLAALLAGGIATAHAYTSCTTTCFGNTCTTNCY